MRRFLIGLCLAATPALISAALVSAALVSAAQAAGPGPTPGGPGPAMRHLPPQAGPGARSFTRHGRTFATGHAGHGRFAGSHGRGYGRAGYGGLAYGGVPLGFVGGYGAGATSDALPTEGPLLTLPRPQELVPAAWGYGTYGVPTISGLAPPPRAEPVVYVINAARGTPARAGGARVIDVTVPRR